MHLLQAYQTFITFSVRTRTFVNENDNFKTTVMSGQGSTGNVIAALASFFIPGLGQLLQGRMILAGVQFVLAAVLWIFLLGWVIHLWSIVDAAMFKD